MKIKIVKQGDATKSGSFCPWVIDTPADAVPKK